MTILPLIDYACLFLFNFKIVSLVNLVYYIYIYIYIYIACNLDYTCMNYNSCVA